MDTDILSFWLSVQVIWVCILCRKKQELLSKTGQWINKGMAAQTDPIMRKIEADLVQQQSVQMEEEYGISIQVSCRLSSTPHLRHTPLSTGNLSIYEISSIQHFFRGTIKRHTWGALLPAI